MSDVSLHQREKSLEWVIRQVMLDGETKPYPFVLAVKRAGWIPDPNWVQCPDCLATGWDENGLRCPICKGTGTPTNAT